MAGVVPLTGLAESQAPFTVVVNGAGPLAQLNDTVCEAGALPPAVDVSASDPIPKAIPGAPSCGRAPAAAAVTIEGSPKACKSAALNTDEL